MTRFTQLLDLSYKSPDGGEVSEEESLDLYLPEQGLEDETAPSTLSSSKSHKVKPALLIFVHGGAWRTGDKKNHRGMAERIVTDHLSFHNDQQSPSSSPPPVAVALINYRLSTRVDPEDEESPAKVIHPAHIKDVYDALTFLKEQGGERGRFRGSYDHQLFHLVGHSVGAWMALGAATLPSIDQPKGDGVHSPFGMPVLGENVRRSIRSFVLVDGIYDLTSLLEEYPSYASFVNQATLRTGASWGKTPREIFGPISSPSWRLAQSYSDDLVVPRLHLLHSKDDELLSLRQTLEAFVDLSEKFDRKLEQTTIQEEGMQTEKTVDFPDHGLALLSPELTKEGEVGEIGDEKEKPKVSIKDRFHPLPFRSKPYLNIDLTTLHGSHDGLLDTQTFSDLLLKIVRGG
ncbi:alpha/beta-hydrolase [Violaceomyces palustris]|uniref:Alpha/beta-hydrolase n=1 Tax=Violaceomyces palustris TaxID=1673888 RepID=A0ACD0NX48_9BASI|nr:alpha/beta-hydrolase [Violaceomyces palustris]